MNTPENYHNVDKGANSIAILNWSDALDKGFTSTSFSVHIKVKH